MYANYLKCVILILLFKQFHTFKYLMKEVRCETIDNDYSKFDLCELATNKPNNPRLSIIIRLLKVPMTNCRVAVEMGFANSERAPLINSSWDGCAFMQNRKKNLAISRLYDYIAPYTNMNHSCPYNHDIYLTNFTLSQKWIIPVPNGVYTMNTKYIIDGMVRYAIGVTVDLTN